MDGRCHTNTWTRRWWPSARSSAALGRLCSDKMQLPWREALSWLGCTIFYINRQTRQATRIVRLDKLLQNAKKNGSIMSQPASMKNGFPTGHVSCDLLERAIPAFLLQTGSNFKHEIQKLRRFPHTRVHFLNCFVVKAVSNRQSK